MNQHITWYILLYTIAASMMRIGDLFSFFLSLSVCMFITAHSNPGRVGIIMYMLGIQLAIIRSLTLTHILLCAITFVHM